MNLIENYLSEIGRQLPPRNRKDILDEIRSVLQDMLDERAAKYRRAVDEDMVVQVLSEYGSPESVAASYSAPRYLIGPQLYPLFTLVLKIVLVVVLIIAGIRMGIELNQAAPGAENFGKVFGNSLGDFFSSLLQMLGNLVIVFAFLQWVVPDLKNPLKATWDPRKLIGMLPSDQIRTSKPIADIIGTLAAIVIFNFYPQIIGGYTYSGGTWSQVGLLTAAFFRFLPLLNVLWGLNILFQIYLLYQHRWTGLARMLSIGFNAATIAIALAMLATPSIFTFNTNALGSSQQAAQLISRMTEQLIPGVLVIIIVVAVVDMARTAFYLLKPRR